MNHYTQPSLSGLYDFGKKSLRSRYPAQTHIAFMPIELLFQHYRSIRAWLLRQFRFASGNNVQESKWGDFPY
jgi:hypothetical protein